MKINKKTGLRTFDMEYVRSKGPCYEPEKFLVTGKRYDAVGILQDERIPFHDRLWVVLRIDLASEKLLRLFAVWSARQVPQTHKDCITALDVAERFALGQASIAELSAARSAAERAAWSAAWSAAESAAESAARSAAESAARSAAERAARSAARSAQCEQLIKMFLIEGQDRLKKQEKLNARKLRKAS